MDAGQSFHLVHVYDDTITHAVVPVVEAPDGRLLLRRVGRADVGAHAARSGSRRSRASRRDRLTGRRRRRVHRHAALVRRVQHSRAVPASSLGASPFTPCDPQGLHTMALDAMTRTRTETDSLGSMEIPTDAYWGIHTARALENFPISKRPISVYRDLVARARDGQAGLGSREQGDRRAVAPRRPTSSTAPRSSSSTASSTTSSSSASSRAAPAPRPT